MGPCCSGVGNCEAGIARVSRDASASALERVHAWRAFCSGEQQRPYISTARWRLCLPYLRSGLGLRSFIFLRLLNRWKLVRPG